MSVYLPSLGNTNSTHCCFGCHMGARNMARSYFRTKPVSDGYGLVQKYTCGRQAELADTCNLLSVSGSIPVCKVSSHLSCISRCSWCLLWQALPELQFHSVKVQDLFRLHSLTNSQVHMHQRPSSSLLSHLLALVAIQCACWCGSTSLY